MGKGRKYLAPAQNPRFQISKHIHSISRNPPLSRLKDLPEITLALAPQKPVFIARRGGSGFSGCFPLPHFGRAVVGRGNKPRLACSLTSTGRPLICAPWSRALRHVKSPGASPRTRRDSFWSRERRGGAVFHGNTKGFVVARSTNVQVVWIVECIKGTS